MNEISLLFYLLSSFLNLNNAQIASESVVVTIDPVKKQITIDYQELFSVFEKPQDSALVYTALRSLVKNEAVWQSDLKGFYAKEYKLIKVDSTTTYNAQIKMNYFRVSHLEDLGVDQKQDGVYSLMNFPNWNLQTTSGKLNGKYWNFSSDSEFTFTLQPFLDLPLEYIEYKRRLIAHEVKN